MIITLCAVAAAFCAGVAIYHALQTEWLYSAMWTVLALWLGSITDRLWWGR